MRKEEQVDSVTRFYGCYKSKASAARAMRNMIGHAYEASFPGLSDRFESVATARADMLAVTELQGGWGISFKFTPADLTVKIRDVDGEIKEVPYPTVAHWENATTPPKPEDVRVASSTIMEMAEALGVPPTDVCMYIGLLFSELIQMPEAETGVTEEHVREAAHRVSRKQLRLLRFVQHQGPGKSFAEHLFEHLAQSVYDAFKLRREAATA